MITVKEYEAPTKAPTFTLSLPWGARSLSIHEPFNLTLPYVLLVAVDTARSSHPRRFTWGLTGQPAAAGESYIGSIRVGLRFLHLFEQLPEAIPA